MKQSFLNRLLATALLMTGSTQAATITDTDPAEGGIGYAHTVILDVNDEGSVSNHVGAWSWQDSTQFGNPGQGTEPVGWTHTSKWVALTLDKATVFTLTMSRDANVPWPSQTEPERKADTTSMFPSFTLWKGWQNDGNGLHIYNNRGPISWAPSLTYINHFDNSTNETVTRTWVLEAGNYTLALGSHAPATNTNRQGFKAEFKTRPLANVDPEPLAGGIGYAWTLVAGASETGSFSDHVGAWSWEDNSLFSPGQPSVGWTHTSRWLALKLSSEVFFALTMERDAEVPWPTEGNLERKADVSSMFPSMTLYRGWDNDGGDHHTYNNRGNIAWAEDVRYMDHVDNSTQTKITRVWRLPAGEYSIAMGSNAPANNTLRQGFKATYKTSAASNIIAGDPAAGGIGYAHAISVGRGDSGSFSNHVGAWSWEDNSLFNAEAGDAPVGWTHTSRWLALHVKELVTINITMSQDANVPWPSEGTPDRKADTTSMFPSFTLWRGWDNDGTDSHSYNNRGNVSWAEGISYLDHYDNSSQATITRSYTLQPGYYTFALGSNAPANNANRQGFRFSWTTSGATLIGPAITQQPKGAELIEGKKTSLAVKATGPDLSYQWYLNGKAILGAKEPTVTLDGLTLADTGNYTVEVRNSAGWITSTIATLSIIAAPVVDDFDIPDLTIGQFIEVPITASHNPQRFTVKGLPRGLVFDSKLSVIKGRPLVVSDVVAVEITASNKAGQSEKQTDTFAVVALPVGVTGQFTGTIARSTAINGLLGGSIRLQVTPTGGLTGTLALASKVHKVAALLDTSLVTPETSFVVNRPGQPALTITLQVNATAKAIYGEVTDGIETLPFIARQPLTPAGAYAGDYTFAMLPEGPDLNNDWVPQGASIGAFKLATTGSAKGVIILADKSKITFGSALEQNGHLTVFNVLYKGTGSLLGSLSIDAPIGSGEEASTTGNLSVSDLSWFKGARAKDRVYSEGFGPLPLHVFGRKFSATELPLDVETGSVNASISFANGGVPDPETRVNLPELEITNKGVKITGANPGKVKLSFSPISLGKFTAGTTGSFKGSFELSDVDASVPTGKLFKRVVSFQGMIVDDGRGLKGYGFFLLPQMPTETPRTTLKTSPILSGNVLLEAKASAE